MRNFFCLPYEAAPAGLYSVGHLVLFLLAVGGIAAGLFLSRRFGERKVRRVIRVITVVLWVLEIAKILFVLLCTGSRDPNDFYPLYYCSLVLYAGAFSSFGKGRLRRFGDVFLATGGIVGGACFLCCPNTSLPRYPAFHFLSLHSFILHGLMVYVGLLLLTRGVYRARFRDLFSYATLVSVVSVAALAVNLTRGTNLMFLSKDFPGTPLHPVFVITGRLFTPVMWVGQATVPFLLCYLIFSFLHVTEGDPHGKRG